MQFLIDCGGLPLIIFFLGESSCRKEKIKMTGWKIFTGYLKAYKLDNQREKDNFPKIKKITEYQQ